MKKVFKLFVLSVMALSMLCGCGSKFKKTDMETVIGILESNDYYEESRFISRETDEFIKCDGLLTNGWKFAFFDFKKDTEACDGEYEAEVKRAGTVTRMEDGNYCIVEADDDIIYRLIVRVDNTYIVIMGGSDEKEDIKDLAREIGYIE